ncbi:hypothetical protein GN956_G17009 [Arapaima gigas]
MGNRKNVVEMEEVCGPVPQPWMKTDPEATVTEHKWCRRSFLRIPQNDLFVYRVFVGTRLLQKHSGYGGRATLHHLEGLGGRLKRIQDFAEILPQRDGCGLTVVDALSSPVRPNPHRGRPEMAKYETIIQRLAVRVPV